MAAGASEPVRKSRERSQNGGTGLYRPRIFIVLIAKLDHCYRDGLRDRRLSGYTRSNISMRRYCLTLELRNDSELIAEYVRLHYPHGRPPINESIRGGHSRHADLPFGHEVVHDHGRVR